MSQTIYLELEFLGASLATTTVSPDFIINGVDSGVASGFWDAAGSDGNEYQAIGHCRRKFYSAIGLGGTTFDYGSVGAIFSTPLWVPVTVPDGFSLAGIALPSERDQLDIAGFFDHVRAQ